MNVPKIPSPVPSEPFVRWDEDLPSLPLGRPADPTPDEHALTIEALQQKYPRTPLELRVLEALRQVAPLPLAPLQIAIMLRVEVPDVRIILQALTLVGAVDRKSRGWYQFPL